MAAKAASRELFCLGVLADLCVGRRNLVNGKVMCGPPVGCMERKRKILVDKPVLQRLSKT
jgi:hypothetical protein